jgi:ribosome-associated translation inhibitor RaiA
MNLNIEFKNFAPHRELQTLIQELVGKIEKKAKAFPAGLLFLRLMVEENPARKLYHASITLTLPEKTLATEAERHDLRETLRDAFAEIEKQLEAHKATLRGDKWWKRRARREELRKLK